jgi:hypothetical protein
MYQLPRLSNATPNGSISRAPFAVLPGGPPQPATHSILTADLAQGMEGRLKTMAPSATPINLTSDMAILHQKFNLTVEFFLDTRLDSDNIKPIG